MKTIVLSSLAAALMSAASLAQAATSLTVYTALEAEQLKKRMFVEVKVNGIGPHRFLVDSGADRSVVSDGLAARLNLPAGESVRLRQVADNGEPMDARARQVVYTLADEVMVLTGAVEVSFCHVAEAVSSK